MIDRESVKIPKFRFSEEANRQLDLMLENDHTLQGKSFRIQITGKGCDGFEYSAGFTVPHKDDFRVLANGIEILIDPFSAFYLSEVLIDYIFDFENGKEGFVITNPNQDSFSGKFWREDKSKIPPLAKNQ